MYKYKDAIDFVIYINLVKENIEIIQLKNIPNIKQMFSNRKIVLYPVPTMVASSTYGIHVPIK